MEKKVYEYIIDNGLSYEFSEEVHIFSFEKIEEKEFQRVVKENSTGDVYSTATEIVKKDKRFFICEYGGGETI